MNVMLLTWNIGSICGAKRYVEELTTGFANRPEDHVDSVFVDESVFWDEWGGNVPGGYDLYVFTDSVPQYWKEDEYGRWWMDLYHQLRDEIVFAVMHDIWWENDREWILDVIDDVDRLVAPQEPVERSLENLPVSTVLIRHPLDTARMDIVEDKQRLIVSASQIKPRKNVDHLIREVPNLDHDVIVHSELTEEYYRLTSAEDPEYGDIWEQALEHRMQFVGVTPVEELWDHYRQARFVVDLQSAPGWSHVINYTQIEPMLFGAVPIVYEDVVNPIMEDHVLTIDHYSELPEIVDATSESELQAMRRDNGEFVVDTFQAERIAGEFVAEAEALRP